jgi:hypothetical protein
MRLKNNLVALFLALLAMVGCTRSPHDAAVYKDIPFEQETHEGFPLTEGTNPLPVARIQLDEELTIWAATKSGVYIKQTGSSDWEFPEINKEINGPVFDLLVSEQGHYLATWKGLYRLDSTQLILIPETANQPISILYQGTKGIYVVGPGSNWLIYGDSVNPLTYALPKSVRDMTEDKSGALWVASDVGLYRFDQGKIAHWHKKGTLNSAYLNGLAWDDNGVLWASGLGGVTKLDENGNIREKITPAEGLSTAYTRTIAKDPDGSVWIGTDQGLARYFPDGSRSLRFSQRWLVDDRVNDIIFDPNGNMLAATDKGVSLIRKKQITLKDKSDFFYSELINRHIREPWTAGQVRLLEAGNMETWQPEDDDNDGEYTSMYLAMESFRYAATKDPVAQERAKKAFEFLKKLEEVTELDGFFARSIVPVDWTNVHDPNRSYTQQQIAIEKVKEPRFKPVESRWRPTSDGKWMWKGDTSSDEMCGHMFGYFFYYTLVADEPEREIIRSHVRKIIDHIIAHDYTLTDIDGKPTRWGVWSPDQLNRNPEWLPDRNLNSMEMLGFLKFAYHITKDERYQERYLHLIKNEGYLDNMSGISQQNPAWFIYFDVMLAAYIYPLLIFGEEDPKLLAFYEDHMDEWFQQRREDQNPLINFIYNYTRNKNEELDASIFFLKDTPLDLIDWVIDHRNREDIQLVRYPVLEDLQVNKLQPPSIRAVVRWDKNPWDAVSGTPYRVREPVFWLLPYWMGRYLNVIH